MTVGNEQASERNLTRHEIDQLKAQGCTARDWGSIFVRGTDLSKVHGITFGGRVHIGRLAAEHVFPGGVTRSASITNATLINVRLGDDVFINHVPSYIANYDIEENAVIDNVDRCYTEGESTFGNGVRVNVLIEAGGRDVPIHTALTAQTAYCHVFYRHLPRFIEHMEALAATHAENARAARGRIGKNARISNTQEIRNVVVGEGAVIENARCLTEGSIVSETGTPAYIGSGVIMDGFIMLRNAEVTGGAQVRNAFIGEAVHVSESASVYESLLFANSEIAHSEVASVFAGPFTVTHHRATLLIAGMFSFYNAGSGTNQSNHMYRLGAVHQGVLERGCKTGSSSYLLFPSLLGAYSVIIGKHPRHIDSSHFPFSYIFEGQGESVLIPGKNLFGAGFVRDTQKFPKRDRRPKTSAYDVISYAPLSPITVSYMLDAEHIVREIRERAQAEGKDKGTYNGVTLYISHLSAGEESYESAVLLFIVGTLLERVKGATSFNDVKAKCAVAIDAKGEGAWHDVAGHIISEARVNEFVDAVATGSITNADDAGAWFRDNAKRYDEDVWAWIADVFHMKWDTPIHELEKDDLVKLITLYENTLIKTQALIEGDARKDFAHTASIGYGLVGDATVREEEFRAIRGSYDESAFAEALRAETEEKRAIAREVLRVLE